MSVKVGQPFVVELGTYLHLVRGRAIEVERVRSAEDENGAQVLMPLEGPTLVPHVNGRFKFENLVFEPEGVGMWDIVFDLIFDHVRTGISKTIRVEALA